jgi:hypothetical protein
MKSGVLLALAVVVFFWIPPAAAQETEVIRFQGTLTGPDGGPLRTDIYNVDFSIWDHATDGFDALWSETQTVEVNEGLFDVFLGGVNPLSPDIFTPEEGESELRFLEIQVEGDDPMTPRLQMAKMPNSFISSRVLGDIETNTGLLRIHPPDPAAPPAIEMSADEIASGMIIVDDRQGEPGENTSIALSADGSFAKMIIVDDRPSGDSGSINIGVDQAQTQMIIVDDRQGEPGENTSIALSADGSFAKMIIVDDKPDENNAVEISADEVGSRLIIVDDMPGPDRTVKIGADEDAASMSLHISDTEVPVMNLRGDILGASFEMSGYETEQQIGPLLGMNTDATGANFAMAAPSYGGLRTDIETPLIEMATGIDMGGSIKMFQPQPEPPGSDPIIEMLAGSSGGNFMMYGQQAGLTSTPFFEVSSYSTGADMKFFESAGGTTVEVNSAGDVIAQRGTFGPNNTNDVTGGLVSGGSNSLYGSYSAILGGYGNNVTTAAEYSCLVGVDATLTADSTFMVDMPHIHFGNEADGYGFPIEDGRPNQMLATNGSGQLYWVDVTLLADENANWLIEENRELKDMISQLERRIEELENR